MKIDNTNTPADYYRRKQKEVDDLIILLGEHKVSHPGCDKSCDFRRSLETALERARYVGD